ncbi:Lipase [Macleaya cordata]|uniref:Lipase n=1 Tax=Macleaya cordata TaxID=56857 RepID=A0A200QPK1_MACCD|nr:Lipase [Macleaya cordata]
MLGTGDSQAGFCGIQIDPGIDGRLDLYDYKTSSSLGSFVPNLGPVDTANEMRVLDLSMMAAKVSYENQEHVKNAVTNHWKKHIGQFQVDIISGNTITNIICLGTKFQKSSSTQAFIFCDTPIDAKLIIVAFRGTDPFNAQDWSADVDLSWFCMGNMGRVHLGFMKALGLQDDKDYLKGWPKNYTGNKELAYYTIREKLRTLLDQNKGARIIITGHSLGLVGDKDFGSTMKANLNVTFKRYHRVVYRYDLVPRVPFDDPICQFVHYGGCLYFSRWYKGEVMKKEPNLNYFNPLYLIPKYFNAWVDLFRGICASRKLGKDFQESLVSILFRMVGLLVPGLASHSPRDSVNSVNNVLWTMVVRFNSSNPSREDTSKRLSFPDEIEEPCRKDMD